MLQLSYCGNPALAKTSVAKAKKDFPFLKQREMFSPAGLFSSSPHLNPFTSLIKCIQSAPQMTAKAAADMALNFRKRNRTYISPSSYIRVWQNLPEKG